MFSEIDSSSKGNAVWMRSYPTKPLRQSNESYNTIYDDDIGTKFCWLKSDDWGELGSALMHPGFYVLGFLDLWKRVTKSSDKNPSPRFLRTSDIPPFLWTLAHLNNIDPMKMTKDRDLRIPRTMFHGFLFLGQFEFKSSSSWIWEMKQKQIRIGTQDHNT